MKDRWGLLAAVLVLIGFLILVTHVLSDIKDLRQRVEGMQKAMEREESQQYGERLKMLEMRK